MREALTIWHEAYMGQDAGDAPMNLLVDDEDHDDDSTWLAQLFYAAISIYASGNYDWDMVHWSRWPGLEIPRLDGAAIQRHAGRILEITEKALDRTSISPLLFLFPLRIAGARVSGSPEQCAVVLGLIGRIACGFAVAHAVTYELVGTWDVLEAGLAGLSGNLEIGGSR